MAVSLAAKIQERLIQEANLLGVIGVKVYRFFLSRQDEDTPLYNSQPVQLFSNGMRDAKLLTV